MNEFNCLTKVKAFIKMHSDEFKKAPKLIHALKIHEKKIQKEIDAYEWKPEYNEFSCTDVCDYESVDS